MNRAHEEIEAAGARLFFIGQGTPRHAAHFQRRFAPDVPVFADEKRASYKAMGIPRGGTAELIGPKSVMKGIGRIATGGKVTVQGRPVGDVTQLGATMIVQPGGEVVWAHVSRDASDNAEPRDVLAALTDVLG